MSWGVIAVLVVGSFGFKAIGVLGLGRSSGTIATRLEPLTALIPAALFAALIAVQTVTADEAIVLDARLWGVGAGTIAVWRRAPFVVVVVVAMAVTAFVRWQTWV